MGNNIALASKNEGNWDIFKNEYGFLDDNLLISQLYS